MPRSLLALLLAFLVGIGAAGGRAADACAVDDCGTSRPGDEHEDERDQQGAAGDEDGADDCPPFCGGCARLAADTAPHLAVTRVAPHHHNVNTVVPVVTRSAPAFDGLFRPPRA